MYEDIKTACLYVRFSSHNQTEQSIEGQTRVCRDFCKRHNIRIVEIYADRATSASKDIEKRVQFLKMIKDSEKGLFDAVIVYKLDRFARSRYDSATYKYRLKRNGVQLISATENISNDPEGIILESVLEGMAEFYSAELSQKINRGMRESAYKHNSIGGAVPLGYKIEDKKLVIDPKTAPLVKEAFEKYADGETVAEICRQFNARGYKTSKGTAFGKSSFTKIFRNERYIGVYTFHDYRAEGAVPAIIDKDLWDRVQLRVGKIKNAPARNKAKVVYLLSGKLFCGHCGSRMNGNSNASNYYYYQCYGKKNGHLDCNKKNIRKEFIERLVAQDALSLLTDEYIEQIATIACEKNQYEIELDSALPTIRDRIHQVDVSLNNLLKAIESGSAPDMLVKRMGELEKEKKDLQVQAKKESDNLIELDKAQVIYWLEQFRGGSIEDEEFCRMLIDLFVNSVTVWDEDDDTYKVTVAYNLTSLPTKTYRLNKGGTLSDFASNVPDREAHKDGIIVLHVVPLDGNLRTGGRIAHLNRAAGFLVHPVQISFCVRHLRLNLKDVRADCLCQRLGNLRGHAGRRKIRYKFLAHGVLSFQYLRNLLCGRIRQDRGKMLHHALFGFLRVSLIGRCDKVVPEKFFRGCILRDTPSIRFSVSVLHIDEICDADIALHLQPRDARLKTGVAALAVVQSLFQPFGKHPAFTGYGFIKLLVLVGRQAVIPTGVKVIAVTPEVRKVRNPLPTHKSSLLVEKFAVKTFAAPRSRSFPFPRTIYIIRKP